MALQRICRVVFFSYLALLVGAASVAVLRLSESTYMPGLQAIELVLLALPWSLALGIEPLSHFGTSTVLGIVIIGLILNALLLGLALRLFRRAQQK